MITTQLRFIYIIHNHKCIITLSKHINAINYQVRVSYLSIEGTQHVKFMQYNGFFIVFLCLGRVRKGGKENNKNFKKDITRAIKKKKKSRIITIPLKDITGLLNFFGPQKVLFLYEKCEESQKQGENRSDSD